MLYKNNVYNFPFHFELASQKLQNYRKLQKLGCFFDNVTKKDIKNVYERMVSKSFIVHCLLCSSLLCLSLEFDVLRE